ncbi:expressed unknown protein [Seminavis robusta]|uniref:Uncharacterized protein n=1 Tax=Seminavis robusta TaxID=568900 RepID=A0A9N8H326_9STRA|nr:expressed unknown protein [Seminavis robusta]|eukprot:Sro30_g019400.1 n/a (463) ;mRNA; r:12761-14594
MSLKQSKHDLDAFLTTLESKMRAPYSSLDLAKIIATPSLRGALSSTEYLQNISQVLARTDKTTQLRTLVGLLGLEPGTETDSEVYQILSQAQDEDTYEEWVRIIAGLARGILFVDDNGEGTRESCRGEESSELLNRTCKEIVSQTRELEEETQTEEETADMYPLFVSYRYYMLGPDLLDRVIPEHKKNPHFEVNDKAAILSMDDNMEKAWAEQAHAAKPVKPPAAPAAQSGTAGTAAAVAPTLPGSTATAKKNASKIQRKKTSMFMPKKRGGMGGRGGVGRPVPVKGTLHTRKAGAAQTLLGQQRGRMGGMGAVRSGANASSVGGRAQRLANNKSKMKLIDVSEVQGLGKQNTKRDNRFGKAATVEQRREARKRKIMEAAAGKGLVGQELQTILRERSNKLSDEDRTRIEQFFNERYNPTPDQMLYKMKLHEERMQDSKETYYLELDYSTFTSKQSKKTKRY